MSGGSCTGLYCEALPAGGQHGLDITRTLRALRVNAHMAEIVQTIANGLSTSPASKMFSLQEVKGHATEDDCWIIVHGTAVAPSVLCLCLQMISCCAVLNVLAASRVVANALVLCGCTF